MPLEVDRIRSEYPALTEGFVHFDGAGGTQPAEPVIAAITRAMRTAVSNRGTNFEPARRSGEIVAAARAAVADLVGGDPQGVVFGPSATALTYLVARTLSQGWGPQDEIVVSRLDHDANVRPWVQAAGHAGARVRWADVDVTTGGLPTGQYRELINANTRLVAVTAASNANGAIPAVRQIADLAHDEGALVYVDGVHATAHLPVDVAALGADFYVTSAYKWSGPHYAAVVAEPQIWEPLHPVKLVPSPAQAPDRFEYGTLSFELLAGITAAVDYLAALAGRNGSRRQSLVGSMTAVAAYEKELAAKLAAGLAEIDGVTVVPAPADRCPTLAFRVAGQSPAETARILGDQGICVSNGDYYAVEFFTATGLRDSGGAVRASIYHYNTADEVDRLLEALQKIR
ncbi:cysteine desulfurase-like protein [Actinoplanes sp. NPDC051343]|uniref:cysteine desulfurase-like protein n=1 Tax=Actinoplanes sp. NPDC051343 TaxID=3363906 RepID=UPI00378CD6AC